MGSGGYNFDPHIRHQSFFVLHCYRGLPSDGLISGRSHIITFVVFHAKIGHSTEDSGQGRWTGQWSGTVDRTVVRNGRHESGQERKTGVVRNGG